MVTVKSKIEEEKQKAEELQRKNEQLAAQARVTAILFLSQLDPMLKFKKINSHDEGIR